MKYAKTGLASVLAFSGVVGATLLPVNAMASETGRRNTTYALGAAAAALLLTQKNKTAGILTGLAAAYAYKRWNDSIVDRHHRAQYWRYQHGSYRYEPRYNEETYRRERGDEDDEDYQPIAWHHDNGKHLGWYKGKHLGWYKHGHERDER